MQTYGSGIDYNQNGMRLDNSTPQQGVDHEQTVIRNALPSNFQIPFTQGLFPPLYP